MATSSSSSDQSESFYLVGGTIHEILGSKLPSRRQVIQLMLHHLGMKNNSLESAKQTANAVESFWKRGGITAMENHSLVSKIQKFFSEYKALKKASKNRLQMNTNLFKTREKAFIDDLDELFDIASSDLSGVTEASKHFLMQQRMKGRPGSFPNITSRITRSQSRTTGRLGIKICLPYLKKVIRNL